ncbi:hypothetical protein HHK36_025768 [Tetracentron sinense]|uniref:Uncharacterized protein n=1 Tax=Tetracentron sinense TaxID=13715 RepID=A0A835D3F7_TETSI|nr:hypothetical protein HHK36_025768 [Tetracentron sinense]
MEEHKWRYLYAFLSLEHAKSLENYVTALRDLEHRAREYYAETIKLSSDEFVKMMLLDGFVFLLRYMFPKHRDHGRDPIFDTMWMLNALHIDMKLLENQLPFFVLERLDYRTAYAARPSLLELTTFYFGNLVKMDEIPKNHYMPSPTSESYPSIQVPYSIVAPSRPQEKHFLHLLQSCYTPSFQWKSPKAKGEKTYECTRSLTELDEAGVKFKVVSSNCFFDVKFTSGELEIPHLQITGFTESFRNLIALEQCHQFDKPYITSYSVLMDSLISTPNDVALLIRYEIFEFLGSNEEVALLFNNLSREVSLGIKISYFSGLCKDLNSYCNMR